MNDFPEGSDVRLECANGHVRESGSGITTCIDGNWSEPDLICKSESRHFHKNFIILSFGGCYRDMKVRQPLFSYLFLYYREGLRPP